MLLVILEKLGTILKKRIWKIIGWSLFTNEWKQEIIDNKFK